MTDIDLGTPITMTRREALREANGRLSLIIDALMAGCKLGEVDTFNLVQARHLVQLAMEERPEAPPTVPAD